jgi:dolichyl-phosphate-mannose-protein mannosyltransferase
MHLQFLHHYLPAHLMSALLAGSVLNFICTETINYPVSLNGPLVRRRARQSAQVGAGMWAAAGVIILAVVACFIFYAPLTYGDQGLSPAAIHRRRFIGFSLHFAK